jgi:hypothetical protein
MTTEDEPRPKGTILGSGLGPRLISDRPDPQGWESYPRRITTVPRYRQRPLLPWRSKLIEEKPTCGDEPGEDGH